MKAAIVQFNAWDRRYAFEFQDLPVKIGSWVVATAEFGTDLGRVVEFQEVDQKNSGEEGEIGPLERVATEEDLAAFKANNSAKKKQEALSFCRKTVKRNGLEMKLVECHFSFDDQKLTFAFIADGRVDFREAVKELVKHFKRSVRLHQLGVRDEAKAVGDVGACGLGLCCRSHLKKLGNVSSEFAERQQVVHRGAERLSGICGRLKCCLAYEAGVYEELAQKLPPVGTRVKTKHGRGEVVGWNILRQSVNVKIDPDKQGERQIIVEVPIQD